MRFHPARAAEARYAYNEALLRKQPGRVPPRGREEMQMSQEPPYPPPGGPYGSPPPPPPEGPPSGPPPAGPPPGAQPPPGYPPPGYPPPGYVQPGYGQPGYPPPGYPPPYAPPPRSGPSVWMIIAIVMGGCAVLAIGMVAIGGAIMFPVLSRAREAARATSCLSHGKQIATGMMMYMQDYDERLPPAAQWETGVMPYVKDPGVFSCPSKPGSQHAFSFNAVLDRRELARIGSPNAEPLFFESRLDRRDQSDHGESFDPRHIRSSGKVGVVAFVDGSVRLYPRLPDVKGGLKDGAEAPEP